MRIWCSAAFLTGVWLPAALAGQQAPAPCLERPAADRAYTRVRLLSLVADQGPNRAAYLIRTCGVRVPFTKELEADLREAGAEESVIAAVREVATKPAVPSPRIGDVKVNPKDGDRYVWIPPGSFSMGCSPGDSECYDDEKPAKQVTISRGFWMGETEVTQETYERVTGTNPSSFKGARLPVETLSWDQANGYCAGVGMKLPSESDWEYAARGGSLGPRYGELDAIAWYSGNSGGRTRDVRLKQANAYGLYDMLGNVWEWTASWYEEGKTKVLRGASWNGNPRYLRVSGRYRHGPAGRYVKIGFRCVGE